MKYKVKQKVYFLEFANEIVIIGNGVINRIVIEEGTKYYLVNETKERVEEELRSSFEGAKKELLINAEEEYKTEVDRIKNLKNKRKKGGDKNE